MGTLETQLNILIDGMKLKEQALSEIKDITENQGTVLGSELTADEKRAFIVQMNCEKQEHIQTVLACDRMFENVLKEIGPELDANPTLYNAQVNDLQQRIRRVMDLDVKIRIIEDENNKKSGVSKPAPASDKPPAAEAPPKTGPQDKIPQGINKKSRAVKRPAPLIQDEARLIRAYESNKRN